MSTAALILLVVVGGIALWGFLTDWTFSGLLPREGARCTPDKDEKDENAKEYVYDEDKECTFIQSCKTNWKPNSSNTACIAETTGDTCAGNDENAIYRYDTSGVCVLDTCKDGYIRDDEVCRSCTVSDVAGSLPESSLDLIEYTTEDGKCVPKRSDFFSQSTFEIPPSLTNTDGDAPVSRGYWEGWVSDLAAGTVEECDEQARAQNAPAYGVRTDAHGQNDYKNTCFAIGGSWVPERMSDTDDSHYTVCTDPTKKVKDACA